MWHRLAAANACRWVTKAIGHAPYVTELPYITHYGCKYVVHGDDITSDSDGNDCYRFVKQAGRFKVVKRSPGISTTDLVGRMLLCTKTHFIHSLQKMLVGEEGYGSPDERKAQGKAMLERMKLYATDETAKAPGAEVWFWNASNQAKAEDTEEETGTFDNLLPGTRPRPGQRIVYVDGGFDLFSSGHIEFLRKVGVEEEELARKSGWYSEEAKSKRTSDGGKDYEPAFVVVGVHDDEVINQWKGVNYPIMNIFERGLCVLQCKVCTAPFFRGPGNQQRETRCSPTFASVLTFAIVYQRCRVWRPIHADKVIPKVTSLGRSGCHLPRPDRLYAAYVRPVYCSQANGNLPGNWAACFC